MIDALSPIELFVLLAAPFVGSWLATLALSWPERPLALARSRCDGCGQTIAAWRMFPLISFALQRGRCQACTQPISPVHPITEALCLGGALAAVIAANGVTALAGAALAWLLVYASMVDLRTHQLPDGSTALIALVGLSWVGLNSPNLVPIVSSIAAALIVGALLFGVRALWQKITGEVGLGLGDVKLAPALAIWMDPLAIAPAVALAGGLTLTAHIVTGNRGERIAFGPGLAAGFFGVWIVWPLV